MTSIFDALKDSNLAKPVQPPVVQAPSPGLRQTAQRPSPASLRARRSQRSRSPANLKHSAPRRSCSPASLKSRSSRRGVSPARGPRDRSPGWCSRAVTPPRKPRQRAQRYVVGQPQRKLCGHEEARTPEHTGFWAELIGIDVQEKESRFHIMKMLASWQPQNPLPCHLAPIARGCVLTVIWQDWKPRELPAR